LITPRIASRRASTRSSATTRASTPRLRRRIRSGVAGVSCAGGFARRSSQRRTLFGLRRGDLAMMRATQHFEPAATIGIWAQVMVTTRAVAGAIARRAVVDLAVTSCRITARSFAEILGASLGGRAGKAPDVVALPGATTWVAAPGASPRRGDLGVAPLTAARLASPRRERTGNAFAFEGAQLAGCARLAALTGGC